MSECLFCPSCSRSYLWKELRLSGTVPLCPSCGYRFDTQRLEAKECEACHTRILFDPAGPQPVCVCRQEADSAVPAPSAPDPAPQAAQPAPQANAQEVPEGQDAPCLIEWACTDPLQLSYDHPRGRDIHFGDAVVVRENQAVCFTSGGKSFWLTRPDTYTLGHDDRSKEEILMARLYGENLGELPPLLDTSVRFFDIGLHRLIPYVTEFFLSRWRILVKIELKFDVQITSAKSLLTAEDSQDTSVIRSVLEEAVYRKLNASLPPQAGAQEAAAFLDSQGPALLEQVTAENDGVSITNLHDVSLHTETSLCPVCHTPVHFPADACEKGHSVQWCPSCHTPVSGTTCANHHTLIYCAYCGGLVPGENGQCLIHRRR